MAQERLPFELARFRVRALRLPPVLEQGSRRLHKSPNPRWSRKRRRALYAHEGYAVRRHLRRPRAMHSPATLPRYDGGRDTCCLF